MCRCPKPEYAERPVSNSDLFSLPQNFSDTENDISVPEETCLSCERCNKFRSCNKTKQISCLFSFQEVNLGLKVSLICHPNKLSIAWHFFAFSVQFNFLME